MADRVLEHMPFDDDDGDAQAAFDPTLILSIVKLLMGLCPRNDDAEVQRKAMNLFHPLNVFAKNKVDNAIARAHPALSRRQRKHLMIGLSGAGSSADLDEIAAVRAME